jgi:TonB family protein
MSAEAQPWEQELPSRRRRLRYRLQAPMDVTVLRSGIPDTLPGRSVNLSEGGVGAWLAGELLPGETVGVQIELPAATAPLRTRALVRHHDKLRYGMEFVGLPEESQAAIRNWVGSAKAEFEAAMEAKDPIDPAKDADTAKEVKRVGVRKVWWSRLRGWILVLFSAAILAAVLWWHWNRGWKDIESDLPKNANAEVKPKARVPSDVMQKLVIHRVDPEYPAGARPQNLQGVIVLNVVVGRDGSVIDMRPQNGPEILARAAMDALRWWRFEPYRVDGKAVVVETTVAMEFNP